MKAKPKFSPRENHFDLVRSELVRFAAWMSDRGYSPVSPHDVDEYLRSTPAKR